MSHLTRSDLVTIEPVGDGVVGEHTRQRLGRRRSTAVQIRAEVLLEDGKRRRDEGHNAKEIIGKITFDVRDCEDAVYSPAHGDCVKAVEWHETEEAQETAFYLVEPVRIGSGRLIEAKLSTRSVQRVTP